LTKDLLLHVKDILGQWQGECKAGKPSVNVSVLEKIVTDTIEDAVTHCNTLKDTSKVNKIKSYRIFLLFNILGTGIYARWGYN